MHPLRQPLLRRLITGFVSLTLAVQPVFAQTAASYSFRVPLAQVKTGVAGGARLTVNPGDAAFGDVQVSLQSSLVLTVSNEGGTSVPFDGVTTSGDGFSSSDNCGAFLAASQSCQVALTFSPTEARAYSGLLSASIDGGKDVATVALSGTGRPGTLSLTPASRAYAAAQVGETAETSDFTLTNTGSAPVVVSGISLVPGSDFSQSNNCGGTLAPAAACTVTASFAPLNAGAKSATLAIASNALNGVQQSSLTGSASAASGSLTATAIATTQVGQSTPGTLTLTNTGSGPLTPTGITSSDPQFTVGAGTCGAALAPAGTCTYPVSFTPTASGASSSTFIVATAQHSVRASTDAGTRVSVSTTVSSSAVEPGASLSTPAFADTPVGESSEATATLSNTGVAELDIGAPTVTGTGFSLASTTCSATLAASASCDIVVRFAPLDAHGARTGQLSVTTEAGVRNAALSALATQASFSVAPLSVNLPDTQLGTTSTSGVVSVTNTGNLPLSGISGVVASPFSVVDNSCGASLAAGATCSFKVGFSPTVAQSYSASVAVTAANSASAASVAVSGLGVQALASVAPSSLTFGVQQTQSTSAAQSVTLSNAGNTALAVSGISVSMGAAHFGQNNGCGTSVAPAGSCVISVSFTPTATGALSGVVSIVHSGPGGRTDVNLSGTGQGPSAALTPNPVAFGGRVVGSTANTLVATLQNTGVGNIAVTAPTAASVTGADFSFVSTTCASSLAPNATCATTVRFSPTTNLARTGALAITTGAGARNTALTGSGLQGDASVTPASLSFAATQVGSTSAAQTVTVTNNGTSPLTVGTPVASGDFDVSTNGCTAAVAVGANCSLGVTVTPSTTGALSGTLSIPSDGAGGARSVSLSGTGQAQSASLTPNPVAFGGRVVGSTANTLVATLQNTGVGTVAVTAPTAASVTGADFAFVSTTCASSLAPNATCTTTVRFSPTNNVARTGELAIVAAGATRTTSLTGTGLQGFASANPTSLSFPATQVSTTAAARSVTVTNNGTSALNVGTPTVTAEFAVSANGCTAPVAVNASCTVSVTATPAAAGARPGTLTIPSDSSSGTLSVSLSVTGQAQSATLTPNPLAYGDVALSSNTDLVATLTNTGIGPLSMTTPSAASVTGSVRFSFVSTTCATSLAAGATCGVTVRFAPSTNIGTFAGTLTVATGAGNQAVALSGTSRASSATATANTADTIVATKGGAAGTGTVTFTNSGNQDAALAMSGLSAPYSVSPASCTAAANNGTCSVTVTMASSGAIGAQVADTLIATGATTGAVNVPVQGTVNGSQVAESASSADTITATKGGASGTGTVTFSNTGNQNVTLTMSGLSAPYSVAPASCVANAGSTCSVTVSMASSGAIGLQAADTLVATGATTGAVNVSVRGTVNGSQATATANTADTIVATKGGAAGTGTVTFTNSGNQNVTLTMSGLAAPYSVAPASCVANANNGTCSVTVSMATSGAFGAQAADTLVATGATTGVVNVPVQGTVNGSQATATANTADTIVATKGGAAGTGTVTFTNSGNQNVTLTMSGLAAPYSVSPASCTAAANNGTCSVTVSMASSGAIGLQAAETLVATGATTGAVNVPVRGTVNGSQWTGVKNAAFGNKAANSGNYTDTIGFRNDGNVSDTITVTGLASPYTYSPSSCTAAAGATCTFTVTMNTAVAAATYNATATTSGGNVNGSASVTGTVVAPALFTVTGPVDTTWTFRNPNAFAVAPTAVGTSGNGPQAAFSSVNATSTCDVGVNVAAGGTCTVILVTRTPDCAANNYSVRATVTTSAGITNTGTTITRTGSGPCN